MTSCLWPEISGKFLLAGARGAGGRRDGDLTIGPSSQPRHRYRLRGKLIFFYWRRCIRAVRADNSPLSRQCSIRWDQPGQHRIPLFHIWTAEVCRPAVTAVCPISLECWYPRITLSAVRQAVPATSLTARPQLQRAAKV